MKIVFVVWMPYHRRSALLAQHLGATIHNISFGQQGRILQAPLRYAVQSWQTWRVLCQKRPDIIFVQNPPIFCAIVVWCYAQCFGAHFAIDSHSGAFLSPRWHWSLPLHRLLSRQALVTIVHNTSQEKIVGSWGCRHCVIGYTPGDYPMGETFALDNRFNVAVVSSFAGDEPIEIMFEAARRLPEACFHLTGKSERLASRLRALKPDNCRLTGYLPYGQYVGLLRGADAIAVLTTRDNTLLMGAFEAVSLGTPLIVSDWPILREYFSQGTVHVPNTAEGICEGVRRAERELATLRRDMVLLRERLQDEWEHGSAELHELLQWGQRSIRTT